MHSKLKILFMASEIEGLVKTGGLADVAKALPQALHKRSHDVRSIIPFYRNLKNRENAKFLAELELEQNNQFFKFNLMELNLGKLSVYAIDYPPYFDREGLYGTAEGAYQDNGKRYLFFSIAALISCQYLNFSPDIVHCNDWHTGLIPFLIKRRFKHLPHFEHTRSIITVHNAAYQGIFEGGQFDLIDDINHELKEYPMEGYICLNMLKCGIRFADKINAVSPTYAKELLTRLGSHGLSSNFEERKSDLEGILNGCDYSDWDPSIDPYLVQNFSYHDLRGKSKCREQLQEELSLSLDNIPLFGMVCRLTEQKGFYLLLPALKHFLRHRVQVVIVGTGEPNIANKLRQLQHDNPGKLRFINEYSNSLAHKVEAACDFFLMPSLFEPCGLNQMYSLAYGTLPIVRGVGGLMDTVIDIDDDPHCATGVVFHPPEWLELLNTLRRALLLYLEQPEEVTRLRIKAMKKRFEWDDSCKEYERLYHSAINQTKSVY